MYLPRMMPSTSNTPTLTCVRLRCSTIALASAIVLTLRGSIIDQYLVSHLRRAVAFALRMAVVAAGDRELFLGREHELVPADEGEVQEAEHVQSQRRIDAVAVHRILQLIVERHQCDHDRGGRARNAERAAIRPLDVGHLPPQLDER